MTDFQGVEYRQHTSCMSEAQKYEKSLYKGNKKQQQQQGNIPSNQQKTTPVNVSPVPVPSPASTPTVSSSPKPEAKQQDSCDKSLKKEKKSKTESSKKSKSKKEDKTTVDYDALKVTMSQVLAKCQVTLLHACLTAFIHFYYFQDSFTLDTLLKSVCDAYQQNCPASAIKPKQLRKLVMKRLQFSMKCVKKNTIQWCP